MIRVRKSEDRGHANHGWLDAYHTFSFAYHHDPEFMGFRKLRVLNQDRIAPGQGFDTHPHKNMEIVTYVLEGVLEHRDSLGNGSQVRSGEVQYMSAGSGILHSEFNPSKTEVLHLLQMWVLPADMGAEPRYGQKAIFRDADETGLRLAASPDGRDDSIAIGQDALLYVGRLAAGAEVRHSLEGGRGAWLHVALGNVLANGDALGPGDGAAIEEESELVLRAEDRAELVLFDLA